MKFSILLFNSLFVLATLLFTTNYAIAGKRHQKRFKVVKKTRPHIVKKRVFKHYPKKRRRNIIRFKPFNTRVIHRIPRVTRKVIHLRSTPRYYSVSKDSICDSLDWSFKRRKCRQVVYDKFYTQAELERCSLKYNDRKKIKCLRRNGFYY